MKHTCRIGFLDGLYIQLASANGYVDKINKKLNLDKEIIKIKKKLTCKKDIRIKVLMLYTIEDEVNEINSKIIQFASKRVKYTSYKYTSQEKRIAAMHTNEIINIKSYFETLYEVKMKDRVLIEKKK